MEIESSVKAQVQHNRLTCNICGLKFGKIQALSSHLKFRHKINNNTASQLKARDKFEQKLVETNTCNSKNTKRPGRNMSPPKLKTNSVRTVNEVSPENRILTAKKKTVFKCPKCEKVFGVYFSAYKHIQRYHCVDANDQPVQQNSSMLIKPIRLEPCNTCHKPETEMHICPAVTDNASGLPMCLGCQKTFDNLEKFDDHVKKNHANNIESYFFPHHSDYISWKLALETSTNTKFAMRTTERKPIQKYHCTHQPSIENKTLICPSFLRLSEFKNGYQVFYYKEHYGHTCFTPLPLTKYKKYSISPYLSDFDIKHLDSDNNVYLQFKSIINYINMNAANVDNTVMNALLGKALEMTTLLNNVVRDDEQSVKKNMSDYEITEVLAGVKTYPGKRKVDSVDKDDKLTNVNKSGLDNNEDSKKNSSKISVSEAELSPKTTKLRSLIQSPQSFNDTYKDFVDQNFNKQQHDNIMLKKGSNKKKVVMKTKIGQFKPNMSPKASTKVTSPTASPKKELSLSPKTPVMMKGHKPAILSKLSGKTRLSPVALKRPLAEKDTPVPLKKSKEGEIDFTRFNVKPEIKYEVKEQENDCNILVLKINI